MPSNFCRRRDVKIGRGYLERIYPQTFFGRDCVKRPLKVGIKHEILALATLDPDAPKRSALVQAIRSYASKPSYLLSVIPGVARIGLDGLPAGRVTDAQFERTLDEMETRLTQMQASDYRSEPVAHYMRALERAVATGRARNPERQVA